MPLFPAEKLRRYPHMFPEDIAIWERFLSVYKSEYLGFDYDIKVGSVPDFPDNLDTSIYKAGVLLWKKRIDAVGYKKDRIEIIEVKPRAGMGAVGQVLTYVALYKKEFAPSLPVFGKIVTDYPQLDIADISSSYGIDVVSI